MKGFKDSTKTRSGFDFSRTTTPVKMHSRAMPAKKMASGGANWIAGATENKGALHRALDVPEGQKIPAKKLAKAAHSKNPTMRKRAALAKTLGAMHKAEGGAVDMAQDKKTVAAAVHKHERHDHPGKPLTKLAKGGRMKGGSHFSKPMIKPGC